MRTGAGAGADSTPRTGARSAPAPRPPAWRARRATRVRAPRGGGGRADPRTRRAGGLSRRWSPSPHGRRGRPRGHEQGVRGQRFEMAQPGGLPGRRLGRGRARLPRPGVREADRPPDRCTGTARQDRAGRIPLVVSAGDAGLGHTTHAGAPGSTSAANRAWPRRSNARAPFTTRAQPLLHPEATAPGVSSSSRWPRVSSGVSSTRGSSWCSSRSCGYARPSRTRRPLQLTTGRRSG